MEESVQKTSGESGGCRPKSKTESEGYGGVHTFMGIVDGKLVEVYVDSSNLLEYILRLEDSYERTVAIPETPQRRIAETAN